MAGVTNPTGGISVKLPFFSHPFRREDAIFISDERQRVAAVFNRIVSGLLAVDSEQLGYHLKNESQWWDVVWNSGFRGMLEKIPSPRREAFKTEHLKEISELVTERGLWLDVTTYFAAGRKP